MNGAYFEASKISVEEWLNIWLHEYMINKRAPKTIESYENNIRKHIIPNIGSILLKDLKAVHVQRLYNTVGEKLSSRMVRLVHITLHAALKQAIKNDLLLHNVTEKCTLPKENPSTSRALSIEEQKAFVSVIKGQPLELAYLFCLYAGLRRGEVMALRWQDINIDKLLVNVNKTIVRVKCIGPGEGERKTKIIIKQPKSRNANRVIPITKELIPYIQRHKSFKVQQKLALGNNYIDNGFLFTDAFGSCIDGSCLNSQFQKLTKGLFLEHATVHTLRHTYVTRGAESGISMKVMQELCGHSRIDITANIYTHVSDDYKAKEAAKIKIIL